MATADRVYQEVRAGHTGHAAHLKRAESTAARGVAAGQAANENVNVAALMQPAPSTSANVFQWLATKLFYPLNVVMFGSPLVAVATGVVGWPMKQMGRLTDWATGRAPDKIAAAALEGKELRPSLLTRGAERVKLGKVVAQKGIQTFAETEISTLKHATSKLAGRAERLVGVSTAPVSGAIHHAEEALFHAAPREGGKLSFVGKTTSKLGAIANDNVKLTDLSKRHSERHFAKANRMISGERSLLQKLTFRRHFGTELGHFGKAVETLDLSANARAAKHAEILAKSFDRLKGNLADGAKGVNTASAAKEFSRITRQLGKLGELDAKLVESGAPGLGNEAKIALTSLGRQAGKLQAGFTKTAGRIAAGHAYSDIGKTIAEAPATLGKMKIHDAAMKGAMTAMTLASYARDFSSMGTQLSALRKLDAALSGGTGESSRSHVLFSSNVSPIVKEARKQLFKQFGPALAIDTAMGGVNLLLSRKGGMSMAAMVPLMGGQLMAGALVPQGTLLPLYHGMTQALSQHKHLTQPSYVALITAASPKIAAVGEDNGLLHAMAKDLEAKQVTPAALMKQIDSGEFDRLAAVKSKELAAAGRKVGEKTVAPHPAAAQAAAAQAAAAPASTVASATTAPSASQKIHSSVTAAIAPTAVANLNIAPSAKIAHVSQQGRVGHDIAHGAQVG